MKWWSLIASMFKTSVCRNYRDELFPSYGEEMTSTDTLGRLASRLHTAAEPDGVVF